MSASIIREMPLVNSGCANTPSIDFNESLIDREIKNSDDFINFF